VTPFVRRTSGWVFRGLAAVLWALSLVGFALWLIGRVFTDESLVTQYLYWCPSVLILAGCSATLVAAGVTRWISRRLITPHRRPRRGAMRAAGALVLLMALHIAFIEWRTLASGPAPRVDASGVPAWRLSYWNVSGAERGPWVQNVLAGEPDLVIIANLWGYKSFLEFRDAFKGQKGPTPTVFFDPRFMVATRWPLVRWGATDLRIAPSDEARKPGGEDRFFRADPGRAAFIELDTSQHPALKSLGRPLVIWIVDLPSDISLPRMQVTRNAASAIASLGASPMEYQAGQWVTTGTRVPFPQPDVIVGDFNIPRGSASLRDLTANAIDAYDAAGSGYAATFPANQFVVLSTLAKDPEHAPLSVRILARLLGRPWWKLDHAFVNPDCRVTGYRVLDPGSGTHRLQMLDLRAANPAATANSAPAPLPSGPPASVPE